MPVRKRGYEEPSDWKEDATTPSAKTAATHYDLVERSDPDDLLRSRQILMDHAVVMQFLEAFPTLAVVLDCNRQIVALNRKALEVFQGLTEDEVFGKRLGEALRCSHATDTSGGCGTSRFCAECGAAQAVRFTRELGVQGSRECRITTMLLGREGALNLRVYTAPLVIDGESFVLFTLKDVAHEKRLQALERIFFHDVLNTAAAINSIAALMTGETDPQEVEELVGMLQTSSSQLIHEIHSQRDLLTAERGELAFVMESATTAGILGSVAELYRSHDLAQDRTLTIEPLEPDVVFDTGPVHLVRCVGNLVKNALEATLPGGEVTVSCAADGEYVYFRVYNPTVMPDSVRLQVFQRSFSTKAKTGRGLGTYSVKLLVEQYLHGKVWFVSNEHEGTVFTIRLPLEFDPS